MSLYKPGFVRLHHHALYLIELLVPPKIHLYNHTFNIVRSRRSILFVRYSILGNYPSSLGPDNNEA